MARLNIEQKWWSDPRRTKLIERVGSSALADGLALNLWRMSQENSGKPFQNQWLFSDEHLDALNYARLATLKDGLIHVAGAAEHHAWILKRRESASAGGRARAENIKKAKAIVANAPQTQRLLSKPVANGGKSLANAEKVQRLLSKPVPSLRSYLNLNLSERSVAVSEVPLVPDLDRKEENTNTTLASLGAPSAPVQNPVGYFIGSYRTAFRKRYPGVDPDVRGKVQGQIKTLLKDYPLERAIQMIQAYLQMDGHRGWFRTKGHDFTTFIENLNPIAIALAQGEESNAPINWEKFWAEQAGSAGALKTGGSSDAAG